jgi:hypothetical protein
MAKRQAGAQINTTVAHRLNRFPTLRKSDEESIIPGETPYFEVAELTFPFGGDDVTAVSRLGRVYGKTPNKDGPCLVVGFCDVLTQTPDGIRVLYIDHGEERVKRVAINSEYLLGYRV